uniref:Uncharacterized protein n=1 Tax=Ditylenchus dipsaci TaxID=166011 RepID=A0A915DNQ8_9BILA
MKKYLAWKKSETLHSTKQSRTSSPAPILKHWRPLPPPKAPTSKPIESFLAAALAASRQQQQSSKQSIVTNAATEAGLAAPLLSSTTQVHSPLLTAMAAAVAANVAQSAASLLSSCGPSPAAILQVNSPAALLAQAQHQLCGESSSSSNNFYSPNSSSSTTLTLAQNHPSAFQAISNKSPANSGDPLFTGYSQHQQQQQQNISTSLAAAAMYPDFMSCFPGFVKEPREWDSNDVIGWLLDVARRHNIPFENFTTQKLLKCAGPLLVIMTEQSFKECDPCYGSLLFTEFRKLISEDTLIDEWMRSGKAGGNFADDSANNLNPRRASLAPLSNETTHLSPQIKTELLDNCASQHFPAVAAASRPHNNGLLNAPQLVQLQQQQQQQQQASHALQQQQLFQHHQQQQQQQQTAGMGGMHQGGSAAAAMAAARQQLLHANNGGLRMQQMGGNNCGETQLSADSMKRVEYESKASTSSTDAAYQNSALRLKIRKNKDGRPRKRSQHTKGNKLWEFIRDALKDASTCPSVVRWEDPIEGVFRIVESEKLARLWGDKKNNQKMTYEKLSRAMRTYYEKQILVPVPKTGLYPKKLVYKFGPLAHGWTAPQHLVAASNHHTMEQLYHPKFNYSTCTCTTHYPPLFLPVATASELHG